MFGFEPGVRVPSGSPRARLGRLSRSVSFRDVSKRRAEVAEDAERVNRVFDRRGFRRRLRRARDGRGGGDGFGPEPPVGATPVGARGETTKVGDGVGELEPGVRTRARRGTYRVPRLLDVAAQTRRESAREHLIAPPQGGVFRMRQPRERVQRRAKRRGRVRPSVSTRARERRFQSRERRARHRRVRTHIGGDAERLDDGSRIHVPRLDREFLRHRQTKIVAHGRRRVDAERVAPRESQSQRRSGRARSFPRRIGRHRLEHPRLRRVSGAGRERAFFASRVFVVRASNRRAERLQLRVGGVGEVRDGGVEERPRRLGGNLKGISVDGAKLGVLLEHRQRRRRVRTRRMPSRRVFVSARVPFVIAATPGDEFARGVIERGDEFARGRLRERRPGSLAEIPGDAREERRVPSPKRRDVPRRRRE